VSVRRTLLSRYFRQSRNYPTHPKTIGEHLRKRRIDSQLSQVQLARILEVTGTALEKWETGHNSPTPEHDQKIIAWLGYDLNERT
jgi:transcriptional regulator with XRE-family HTH domain